MSSDIRGIKFSLVVVVVVVAALVVVVVVVVVVAAVVAAVVSERKGRLPIANTADKADRQHKYFGADRQHTVSSDVIRDDGSAITTGIQVYDV